MNNIKQWFKIESESEILIKYCTWYVIEELIENTNKIFTTYNTKQEAINSLVNKPKPELSTKKLKKTLIKWWAILELNSEPIIKQDEWKNIENEVIHTQKKFKSFLTEDEAIKWCKEKTPNLRHAIEKSLYHSLTKL